MMFRTHIVVSLLVALIILPLFSLDKASFLVMFLFAALLPDIDTATSFIGRRAKLIGWAFRHRGWFHSLWMLTAFSVLVWLVSPIWGIVFCLGYAVHLLADMLNHEGIAPLYPLHWRLKGFIRTGSFSEHALFLVCLAAGFWLFLKQ